MNNQETPPTKQSTNVGEYGAYYVSIVNKSTGFRQVCPNLATEQEARKKREEKENNEQRAHAYEYNKKENKYVKIAPR